MSKIVRQSFDVENPPPLTNEQMDRLKKLAARLDSEIDFSDIPKLNPRDWKKAKPNPLFKNKKEVITSKIDSDVLNWLKSYGKGYQTLMNNLLRKCMIEAKTNEKKIISLNAV